jgi:hypothetical protein
MANVSVSTRDPRGRPAERRQVPLDKVEFDRSTQGRERLNPHRVDELAGLLARNVPFQDDIELYEDDGAVFWIADGFHRVAAYRKARRARVWALVRPGGHRDALLHAAGANATHGLPRSRGDVRRSVLLLLRDDEYKRWADNTIAKMVNTDNKTVARVREAIGQPAGTTYIDRYGNETTMDTANIKGRPPAGLAWARAAARDLAPGVRPAVAKLVKAMSLQEAAQNVTLLALLKRLPTDPGALAELCDDLK